MLTLLIMTQNVLLNTIIIIQDFNEKHADNCMELSGLMKSTQINKQPTLIMNQQVCLHVAKTALK